MELQTIDGEPDPHAAEVAQHAVDATATAYTRSPDIDVEQELLAQLRDRGLAPSDTTLQELATAIRSGHRVQVDRRDGPVG
ncbi:hypothetical protein [Nocardioides xinjiangensis]|uniref:hypothetical protein n=1 Tax=Nocardioides xinjiangensis TaxID=2817376 RepID=UPI001B314901|nr:hypothetical protein [Nocardioides sp. SYSU D00778]